MYSRSFLSGVKKRALRKGVWHKVLDKVDRGIISLTIRFVEEVRSVRLGKEIVKILAKLKDASKSGFVKHLETYGREAADRIGSWLKMLGYDDAAGWRNELAFIRYLTLINYYKPSGFGVNP